MRYLDADNLITYRLGHKKTRRLYPRSQLFQRLMTSPHHLAVRCVSFGLVYFLRPHTIFKGEEDEKGQGGSRRYWEGLIGVERDSEGLRDMEGIEKE